MRGYEWNNRNQRQSEPLRGITLNRITVFPCLWKCLWKYGFDVVLGGCIIPKILSISVERVCFFVFPVLFSPFDFLFCPVSLLFAAFWCWNLYFRSGICIIFEIKPIVLHDIWVLFAAEAVTLTAYLQHCENLQHVGARAVRVTAPTAHWVGGFLLGLVEWFLERWF